MLIEFERNLKEIPDESKQNLTLVQLQKMLIESAAIRVFCQFWNRDWKRASLQTFA